MATSIETAEYILNKLNDRHKFSVRSMFGEYALYADGKVVGLICDNQLYVKILPASKQLEGECEKDTPYPGAKDYFVVTEEMLTSNKNLPSILGNIGKSLTAKKK